MPREGLMAVGCGRGTVLGACATGEFPRSHTVLCVMYSGQGLSRRPSPAESGGSALLPCPSAPVFWGGW